MIGPHKLVMINDWRLAKTVLARAEFSGRLMNYTTLWARSVKGKNLGLVMNDGSFHSKQKNFCLNLDETFLWEKHMAFLFV